MEIQFVIVIRYLRFMEKSPRNILIAASTSLEISPLLRQLNKRQPIFKGKNLDVLITGIGLTATTYHLCRQFSIRNYDLAIQAGVAGCFDLNRTLGSVVAIKQDTIADQSVVELEHLKSLFDLKLVPQNRPPFSNGWLKNRHTILLKTSGLDQVPGVSVNQISTSEEMIRFYRKNFNPVAESMEGASFHYVCLMEKIPFIQLRSFSNYIGERNKKNWYLKRSVLNLNDQLSGFLEKL